jgi:transcriptional regulator with PAS, ATPase and Fis domain
MLNSYLSLVKEEAARLAEVISSALKIEVEIVDDQITVIGATSYYVQNYYYDTTENNSCISREVINNKKPLIMTDHKTDPICQLCSEKESCYYAAGIYMPIMMDEACLGVISLVAFNDEQRIIILENRNAFLKFAAQMAEMLIIAVREKLHSLGYDETAAAEKHLEEKNEKVVLADIIGPSAAIENIKRIVQQIKDSSSSVLLIGESGTGKEMFAKSIHYESMRRDDPYIAVNCAAIPENLLESELFGYEDGAFTGARRGGKQGLFEAAANGTLFLDEIGDMPLILQSKLLRALQEETVMRIGGTRPNHVSCRVITATHENLKEKMKLGTFRKDLFYRINVIPIEIPPLRERHDDVIPLTEFFVDKYSKKLNVGKLMIAPNFMAAISGYEWPGNVRELENAVEYAVNFAAGKSVLSVNALPEWLTDAVADLESDEKGRIISLLKIHGHSVEAKKAVAGEMNINISTLYRKMKKYGLT